MNCLTSRKKRIPPHIVQNRHEVIDRVCWTKKIGNHWRETFHCFPSRASKRTSSLEVEAQLADEKRGDRADQHPQRRKRKAHRRANVSSIDQWERFSAVMIFSSFTKTNHWDIKATKTRISSFFPRGQVRCCVLAMDFKVFAARAERAKPRRQRNPSDEWH